MSATYPVIISKPIMSGSHSSIMVWKEASRSSEAEAVGSLSSGAVSEAAAEGAAPVSGDEGALLGAETATESLSLAVAMLSPRGASAAFWMAGAATTGAAASNSSRDNRFLAASEDMGIVASSRRVASTVKWLTTQLGADGDDDDRRRVAITEAFDFCNEMEIELLLI